MDRVEEFLERGYILAIAFVATGFIAYGSSPLRTLPFGPFAAVCLFTLGARLVVETIPKSYRAPISASLITAGVMLGVTNLVDKLG